MITFIQYYSIVHDNTSGAASRGNELFNLRNKHSRPNVAQGHERAIVNATGCGFDSHSKK